MLYSTCKFKTEIFILLSHITKWRHVDYLHVTDVCLHELPQLKARRVNVKQGAIQRAERMSDGVHQVV